MKKHVHTNMPIILFCTGMVFILLLLTMIISNWIVIIAVNSGLIAGRPETPLIPFLIQTGLISIIIGVILTLVLSCFPLKPVGQLIRAIHAVADGNFQTKIYLKHPRYLRELSESFNQMTDELSGTEMLRSDFINNFSHEFKTPIVSVMGFAELLKKNDLNDNEKTEYLDIIITECKRLADLSSNVLNLSRIESIAVLTGMIPYNVSEQIRQSILQLERKWEQKGIVFDLDLGNCIIICNPDLLKQVWVNLIDNAVKFSPHHGKILIHAEKTDRHFIFRISDSGVGMTRDTQEKIFERFYQGDLSHSAEGNGLGLSLVKEIISLHHGTVTVESEPEKGSTFTVTIPV